MQGGGDGHGGVAVEVLDVHFDVVEEAFYGPGDRVVGFGLVEVFFPRAGGGEEGCGREGFFVAGVGGVAVGGFVGTAVAGGALLLLAAAHDEPEEGGDEGADDGTADADSCRGTGTYTS